MILKVKLWPLKRDFLNKTFIYVTFEIFNYLVACAITSYHNEWHSKGFSQSQHKSEVLSWSSCNYIYG